MSVSLTFRCPDDLAALIASQVETTGQDKTSVVVGMLRSSLPSLPLADKNNLPAIPAIYLVWSSNTLLYIGKTSNLKKRFYQHHRIANFLEAGNETRIAWFSIDSNELPSLEEDLIELLEPDLNHVYSGKPSTKFCFRLPDEAVKALEALQLEGESLNQTAQRFVLEKLGLLEKTPQPLPAPVDIKELVKQEIEASLAEMRSQFEAQLEELRGKSKAR